MRGPRLDTDLNKPTIKGGKNLWDNQGNPNTNWVFDDIEKVLKILF